MEKMHGLLKRQLKQHFGESYIYTDEMNRFLESVNRAYVESDTDREMIERSLELSSYELVQANSEMWAIFQAIPDLLFRINYDGKILAFKAGETGDLLLNPKDLIGKKIQDIPDADVKVKFSEAIDCVKNTKTRKIIEYSLLLENKLQYFEARLLPLLENQIIVIVRNITERIIYEEKLNSAKQQFLDIIDFLPDATFVIDRNKKVIAWNRAIEAMTGVKKDDILGKGDYLYSLPFYKTRRPILIDLVNDPDPEYISKYKYVIKRGNSILAESYIPHVFDGKGAYLWAIASPLLDSQGNSTGAIESIRDITERVKSEEALRESNERYRLLYEDNPSMYFTLDASGKVLSVNRFGCEQLGYEENELIGQSALMVFFDEDKDSARSNFYESVKYPGKVFYYERRKKRKNGSMMWVKETLRSGMDQFGNLVVYIVCDDITKRKYAEEERARLEQQLRQVQKMESVGLLAGGIAHDFNNLLTPIFGSTAMLLDEISVTDPRHRLLGYIMQSANRAKDLTRQLLAFSRSQVLELKTIDVRDVVRHFEHILRRTIRENINIEIVLSPIVNKVKADISQIEQVMLNLAVNAQDAMPTGGSLTIKVENIILHNDYSLYNPDVTAGLYVMIEFSDTGAGMDTTTKERLFEPFFTTKERGKGTGLGLSTAYGIIKQHGGSISVSSVLGEGSSFKVFLPSAFDDDEKRGVEVEENESSVLEGHETILIVEDDEMVRMMSKEMLEDLGYSVIDTANAEECFMAVENHRGRIDLLLTDVILPKMDGRELYHRLRSSRENLKVVYMSGYAKDVIGKHGVLSEGVNFLPKPFTIQQLSLKIRKALGV